MGGVAESKRGKQVILLSLLFSGGRSTGICHRQSFVDKKRGRGRKG